MTEQFKNVKFGDFSYLVISTYNDKPKGKRMQLSIFFDDDPGFFDERAFWLNRRLYI